MKLSFKLIIMFALISLIVFHIFSNLTRRLTDKRCICFIEVNWIHIHRSLSILFDCILFCLVIHWVIHVWNDAILRAALRDSFLRFLGLEKLIIIHERRVTGSFANNVVCLVLIIFIHLLWKFWMVCWRGVDLGFSDCISVFICITIGRAHRLVNVNWTKLMADVLQIIG